MVPSMREKYDTIRHMLSIVVSITLWCIRKFCCSIADRGICWLLKNRYLSLFVRHQVDVAESQSNPPQ